MDDRYLKYVNTDLACESGRISPEDFCHAKYTRRTLGRTTVERLSVEDAEGEEESGRPRGSYVTLSNPFLKDGSGAWEDVIPVLKEELLALVKNVTKTDPKKMKILVAGLGNRAITPDALGARCADKINATRHVMAEYDVFKELGCSDVSVIKPGVLSETGIESSDMIKGVVSIVSPDVLIVIDAMSARCVDRLASTVQLSDTGISPGKGIGNRRPAVDRESVGCAVVSIGVPTVVDSSTLICDALQRAGIEEISAELEAILENGKSFFVSLNDSDMIIERLSDVISKALNEAFGTAEL